MKILHIINNLGSGGAEKLIEETVPLYNRIDDVKADVLLLTDQNSVFDINLKDKGIKVDVVHLKQLKSPINIYYIRKYIIKGGYNIVHAHLFPSLYWVSIAARLIFKNKPKFIITEHNTHNRRREKPIYRYVEKFIYSSYDKIISISEKTEKNLISWLNLKKHDKFVTISNGINIDKFGNAQPYKKSEIHHGFTNDTRLICMTGSFSKQKDQLTIIKAMRNLTEDIHLLLIGEGDLKEQSQNLAIELGVENRVHFLGFRSDVDRVFKSSDAIVLSSHWEGFGLVAVEGMAAGKPVIASDVDGLREVVEGTGLLFLKGDYNELANIIRDLFNNQNEYDKISQACLERSKKFSIERMVRAYMKEYGDLLSDLHYK